MRSVGVRELKEHTSQILRQVRGEIVEITHRGQVIARLLPARPPLSVQEDWRAFWDDWDKLSADISGRWPPDESAEGAISDVRRDLGSSSTPASGSAR